VGDPPKESQKGKGHVEAADAGYFTQSDQVRPPVLGQKFDGEERLRSGG